MWFIHGSALRHGHKDTALTLMKRLMHEYAQEVLAPSRECGNRIRNFTDLFYWVNKKLESSDKASRIRLFHSSTKEQISSAVVILDFIDSICPNVVDFSPIGSDKMKNANYAIACARKIGANVHALPEDVVEVNDEMVTALFECLVARAFAPDLRRPALGHGEQVDA